MTPAGLEPAASGLGIPRSILLSYGAVGATLPWIGPSVQINRHLGPRHFDSPPVNLTPVSHFGVQFWQSFTTFRWHTYCKLEQTSPGRASRAGPLIHR